MIDKYPGVVQQGIAINHVTNRLYLILNGVFYTMSIDKLSDGTLEDTDMGYTVLNSNLEFGWITFDSNGNNYLLVLRGAEILKSKDFYIN